MVFTEIFTNELGNKIVVKVKNKKAFGKNYKSGKKFRVNGINFKIIGPTSMSDNTITLLEARVLYKQLGKCLRSAR